MARHDIVVVGASAGGVEALKVLIHQLPADIPAAIFVVLHVAPHATSVLPQILKRSGLLPAVHAEHGAIIQAGHIYVAPPDQHLILRRDRMWLSHGPHENGHRPAVDPLFRSAAREFGRRVIGVILSGSLDDGSAGMVAVHHRGGLTVVQTPEDAMYDGMPRAAIEHVAVDHVVPVDGMGTLLAGLVQQPVDVETEPSLPPDVELEAEMAEMHPDTWTDEGHPGTPSGFGCPDCGGALWEIVEGDFLRFRCRIGHAWSANSLLAEQTTSLETALWTALRALEEKLALSRRLIERARQRGHELAAVRFQQQADECERQVAVVRAAIARGPGHEMRPS